MSVDEVREIVVAGLDMEPCSIAQLLDWSFSLVIHDQESNSFKFAHASVRDYLISRKDGIYKDVPNHEAAAYGCINVLLEGEEKYRDAYSYAKVFWGFHSHHAMEAADPAMLENCLNDFLDDDSVGYSEWQDAMSNLKVQDIRGDPRLQSNSSPIVLKNMLISALLQNIDHPMFAAALWGIPSVVEKFLPKRGSSLPPRHTISICIVAFFQTATWHAPGESKPLSTERRAVDLLLENTSEVEFNDDKGLLMSFPRQAFDNIGASGYPKAFNHVKWLATLAQEMAAKRLPGGKVGQSVTDAMIDGMVG